MYDISDTDHSDNDNTDSVKNENVAISGMEYLPWAESDDDDSIDELCDEEEYYDRDDNEANTFDFASNNNDFKFMFNNSISKQLVLWAIKFWISHEALSALLLILRNFGHKELPKLAPTLLHTPRKAVQTRPCAPGEFFYRGIQYAVLQCNKVFLTTTETVTMDFFIDGLSLSDSSKMKMWPIMGSYVGQPKIRPIVVGCYSGKGDPSDPDDFLREFVDELIHLTSNGILVTKDKILKNFECRLFVADSPARAFATGTMSHASYFGCPRCNQVCCGKGHKLYYQFFVGELRTDESFQKRQDVDHHKPQFQHRPLLIESVMGMVSQFIIDCMHAVDLGVTKKIVKAVVSGICTKDTKTMLNALQSRFLSFRAYVPSEFARKPRTLHEIGSFKATECRQMLLYTLPVLLKNIVPDQVYKQVIKLHVAIRLLSDPIRYKANVPAAKQLINEFVYDFDETFGADNFTFNTHILLHIPDDVEKYGPLYSLSAYKYENHMRLIKLLLRRKNGHIQQFFNRIEEMRYADEIQSDDEKNESRFDEMIIDAGNSGDNCFLVQDAPLIVTKCFTRNDTKMISGFRFLQCSDFYVEPIKSMENMGILLASNLSTVEEEFNIDSIVNKFFRMPYEDKFVLVPILHER